jgi:catechol 2,3-dioxygenase-like lactoylglutathione lyase family enzyme
MLTDRWDIAHICIAVPDMEQAMKHYEAAFGIEAWGPLLDYTEGVEIDVASPMLGGEVSMRGLGEIWSLSGSEIVSGSPPFAPFELASAAPFSPSSTIWGCPDGREYVHHICYWVDDLVAEADHLIENGFSLELTIAPGDRAKGFAYLVSPAGMRVELMQQSDKAAFGRWLKSGVIELDWAADAP